MRARPAARHKDYPPPPDEADDFEERYWARRRLLGFVLIGVAAVLGLLFLGITLYVTRAPRGVSAEEPPLAGAGATRAIPDGAFVMGMAGAWENEAPPHEVRVLAFEIDETEVTVLAYRACVERGGCTLPQPGDFCTYEAARDLHPVNCVDHDQAAAYCEWVAKRLPTEAEWEYAARGTDGRRYPWGNDEPGPKRLNVCDGSCASVLAQRYGGSHRTMFDAKDGFGTTAPVGTFSPAGDSALGVKDLAGNVWEWTSSTYCPYGEPACESGKKVVRGGGWNNYVASNVSATARFGQAPQRADNITGFRCAR